MSTITWMNHQGLPWEKWHYPGMRDGDGTIWWRGVKGERLARGTEEWEDWSNGEWGKPEFWAVWISHRKQINPAPQSQVQASLFHQATPGLLQPEATEQPLAVERLSCTAKSMEELWFDSQRCEVSNRSSFGDTEKDTRTDSAECRLPTAQVNGLPVPKMQQAGIRQSQSCICQTQAFPTVLWQVHCSL